MIFNNLILFSLDISNGNISLRIPFTINQTYFISNCYFISILSNTQEGGSIYIKSILNVEILRCLFQDSSASNFGGACYTESNLIKFSFSCIDDCRCSNSGSGIYIFGYLNASLYYSSFRNNSAHLAAWILKGTFCDATYLNSTNCISNGRESVGHFTYGPNCYSNMNIYNSNKGPYVFFPYTVLNYCFHEYSNFLNNSNSIAIFCFTNENIIISNCIFINNSGKIVDSYATYIVDFYDCIFDTNFIGIVRNTINCKFLQSNIIPININYILWCNYNNYLTTNLNKLIYSTYLIYSLIILN